MCHAERSKASLTLKIETLTALACGASIGRGEPLSQGDN